MDNAHLGAELPASLSEMQVELQFISGRCALDLRQLRQLSMGEVVRLDRPVDARVEIHANGLLVGRGELVDIEGRLAVEVTELCRPA